jgi:signal transduction histidine kinase
MRDGARDAILSDMPGPSSEADYPARQRAALQRVSQLIAQHPTPDEVFAAVTAEAGELLGVEDMRVVRFEPDDSATVVASWGVLADAVPVGTNKPLAGATLLGEVRRTGRTSRKDHYERADGELVKFMLDHGVRSSVAGPIVVGGQVWGAVVAASVRADPPPPDTERRLEEFIGLVETSISSMHALAVLTASRARIVAAADAARRQLERDLHDGVQQRLVSIALQLRAAELDVPDGLAGVRASIERAIDGLEAVVDELRDLSRGVYPAILSEGGLGPALRGLARRSPVPVQTAIGDLDRLDEALEVAAYYVVSEALTNTAKHARATRVDVRVGHSGDRLEIEVVDDGVGGAAMADGRGLTGLSDRVETFGGRLHVSSPPGRGTSVRAWLPARRG